METGAGDDSVLFGSSWDRVYDWFDAPAGNFYGAGVVIGRGAWIDVGDGDDRVEGTEGNDFIIGGAGNDWLEGIKGADTYFVDPGDSGLDRIVETPTEEMDLRYGEAMSLDGAPNQDTIEFAAGVALADLSYRWRDDPGSVDYWGPLRVLQLFHHGRMFSRSTTTSQSTSTACRRVCTTTSSSSFSPGMADSGCLAWSSFALQTAPRCA